MIRRPPRATRTDTLFPYTTLFRSHAGPDLQNIDGIAHMPVGTGRRVAPRAIHRPGWAVAGHGGLAVGLHLAHGAALKIVPPGVRSEEHTSELQSLMRISYAVFCLKKKKQIIRYNITY